jgi:hypothetical protein
MRRKGGQQDFLSRKSLWCDDVVISPTKKRLFRLALGTPGRAASHPQTEKIAQGSRRVFQRN